MFAAILTLLATLLLSADGVSTDNVRTELAANISQQPSDQSSIMNIWNYQIERKVKTSLAYKQWDLAVWEEIVPTSQTTADKRYYVTPPVTLIPSSAICEYTDFTQSYSVTYDIQLWEKDLASAVVAALKKISLTVSEDQIHPLPFYQARVVWNNPEQQLHELKLTSAWINNLQQQQTYRFRVAAKNNGSCFMLADAIRTRPDEFSDSIQLQFTVSAAKIDSKQLNIKSEHIVSSQLVASMKNMPNANGPTRYLTSTDYNRMLLQIANQVVASEITSGDYIDTDDELSLKDVISSMFDKQEENTAQFDDRMWNSVFWDPIDERPDKITSELNKAIFINQTDHRAYLTKASSSSSSAKVNAVIKLFHAGAEGSHASSSSMTTDDLSHLLSINDVESSIQGEKFVAKKLDLTRLNLNDLLRDDLLTTKRVKVRQVEIGGVLQVAIGNASIGQILDENRYLRQQLSDAQATTNALQTKFNQLQASHTGLQSSFNNLAGQVQAIVNSNLQGQLAGVKNDVNGLKGQAANIHVYSCTSHTVRQPYHDGRVGDLMQGPTSCPPGKYLTSFALTGGYANMFYQYTCC